MCHLIFNVVFQDPDRYVTSESKKEPELPGALCEAAGVLSGIRYG